MSGDQELREIFTTCSVLKLDEIMEKLHKSRMSVIRYLNKVGYHTSYNFGGIYYTLHNIPSFDSNGIWKYDQAFFSVYGPLRNTLTALVNSSSCGYNHEELQDIVGLRTYNTLRDLTRDGKILRQVIDGTFVYLSLERREEQIDNRSTASEQTNKPLIKKRTPRAISAVGLNEKIEVLVAYIGGHYEPLPLYHHLYRKGVSITPKQVKSVFEQYGLSGGKKKKMTLIEYQKVLDDISELRRRLNYSEKPDCILPVSAECEITTCPLCGAQMTDSKTVRRATQTLIFGSLEVMEQHRYCPNGCVDPETGLVVHTRSELLADMINHGCCNGYDIEAYIGIEMYMQNRQAKEVHTKLQSLGLKFSESEVLHLAAKFQNHVEKVHFANAVPLGEALRAEGGHVSHIDATCEKGKGGMFAVLSGWDNWVLVAGKIDTEHYEQITPYLQRSIDIFGPPVAIVRDLGKAMHKAVHNLVLTDSRVPRELICHYHFLKDIGTDLLTDDHNDLLKEFRKLKIKKLLQDIIRKCNSILAQKNIRNSVIFWLESSDVAIPDGFEGIAVLRSLAQHLLDYAYDKSRKKFPFTRPYLEFYNRSLSIGVLLAKERVIDRHTGKTEKLLRRLHCIISSITNSESLRSISAAMQEKVEIFDKLRQTLRLDSEGGYISKAGEVESDGKTIGEMEKNHKDLLKQFELQRENMGPNARKAVDIIFKHIKDHGKFLWGRRIEMKNSNGDTIVRYAYRTNNVIETWWRPLKRYIRRRNGSADAGYSLEHVSSSTCCQEPV